MEGSVFYQCGSGLAPLHRVLTELEPAPSELFAAGFIMDRQTSVSPNLLAWYHPGVCHAYAAYDHRLMGWRFRAKNYREGIDPSPVFDSVSAMLVWLRVEGWLNG